MKASVQVKFLEDDLEALQVVHDQLIEYCVMLMDEGLNGMTYGHYIKFAKWWQYNVDDGAQFWRSKNENKPDGQDV